MQNDEDKNLLKVIDDNRKWKAKRTRIISVLLFVLIMVVLNLVTYIAMGERYFTDFLGK